MTDLLTLASLRLQLRAWPETLVWRDQPQVLCGFRIKKESTSHTVFDKSNLVDPAEIALD